MEISTFSVNSKRNQLKTSISKIVNEVEVERQNVTPLGSNMLNCYCHE